MFRLISETVSHGQPACIGSGLVTLDVVISNQANSTFRFWAGGSCGNVLTILSYLGWRSFPVARLGDDPAATAILEDLSQFDVLDRFIHVDERVSTPIIVERIIRRLSGVPSHRFEWKCPRCGGWLPRFRPVLRETVRQILTGLPEARTFYFDRISSGILELALHLKFNGALVVFEPSGMGKEHDFIKALQVAHIVKYSRERLAGISTLVFKSEVPVVVETLGSEGLRYRLTLRNGLPTAWRHLPAIEAGKLRDAAGAGDWCTAGIIHFLGQEGAAGLGASSEKEIIQALQLGQALAALNCCFEGARGGMYALDKARFDQWVKALANETQEETCAFDQIVQMPGEKRTSICPSCTVENGLVQ
ncbi:MAG: carbohydrate kinase [Desulfomonile tiedjei]|nr:carbohydrate kinase [Desulfomonile tiedjei]